MPARRRELTWLHNLDAELTQWIEVVDEKLDLEKQRSKNVHAETVGYAAGTKTILSVLDYVQGVELAPRVSDYDVLTPRGAVVDANQDTSRIEAALAAAGKPSPYATPQHPVDVSLTPGWDGVDIAMLRDAVYLVAARKREVQNLAHEAGAEGDATAAGSSAPWRSVASILTWDEIVKSLVPGFDWSDWGAVADIHTATARQCDREPRPRRGAAGCAVMWHARVSDTLVQPVPPNSYLTAFDHATQVRLREVIAAHIAREQLDDRTMPPGSVDKLCAAIETTTGVRMLPYQALRAEAEFRMAYIRPGPQETVQHVLLTQERALLSELLHAHGTDSADYVQAVYRREARARRVASLAGDGMQQDTAAGAAGNRKRKAATAAGEEEGGTRGAAKKRKTTTDAPSADSTDDDTSREPAPGGMGHARGTGTPVPTHPYCIGPKRPAVEWAWLEGYVRFGFDKEPATAAHVAAPPRLSSHQQQLEEVVARACYGAGSGAAKDADEPAKEGRQLRYILEGPRFKDDPRMSRAFAFLSRFGKGYGGRSARKYAEWMRFAYNARTRKQHRGSYTRVPNTHDAPEGRLAVARRYKGKKEKLTYRPLTQFHLPARDVVAPDGTGSLTKTPAAVLKALGATKAGRGGRRAGRKPAAAAPEGKAGSDVNGGFETAAGRVCTAEVGPLPSAPLNDASIRAVAHLCQQLCGTDPTREGFVPAFNAAAAADADALSAADQAVLAEAEGHASATLAASAFAAALGEPAIAAARTARQSRLLQ